MKTFTKILCLALPILLFFVLVIPYSWVNGEYIVDWLGCGCPVYNEDTGTTVTNKFNANDFTACFWLFITVCATVMSVFLTKLLPKGKAWLKILYVVGVFAVSLAISYWFYQNMMWN